MDSSELLISSVLPDHLNSITASEKACELWCAITAAAVILAEREPLLQYSLQELILSKKFPGDMIAGILARKLNCINFQENEIAPMIAEIFQEDESIFLQATRDINAVRTRDPACPDALHVLINLKGFQALQIHRISNHLWRKNRKELAFALANQVSLKFCIDIHPAAQIGGGIMLDHGTGVVIGETVVIDDDVSIMQNVTLGGTGKDRGNRHPKIRTGVMLGAGCKILGNIEIGMMSKIAAGSVVLKNIPPYSTAAGIPAQIVRQNRHHVSPAFTMNQSI